MKKKPENVVLQKEEKQEKYKIIVERQFLSERSPQELLETLIRLHMDQTA